MGFFGKLFGRAEAARIPLETQLQEFEKLGIRLNEGFVAEDLLELCERDSIEKKPFVVLYHALSGTPELREDKPYCDQIWGFDEETLIEDVDYPRLLQNVGRISGGEMNFANIELDYREDELDPIARVSFHLNGEHYHWALHHYEVWNSYAFLSPLNEHARSRALKGRLVWNRSWGDDQVLAWHTPEQLIALQRMGLDIAEITPGVMPRKHPRM